MDQSGQNKRPAFSDVLEKGAQVDDIFRDQPSPKGSNPFGAGFAAPAQPELALVVESDNEALFVANRKIKVIESLFKLLSRDYYSFGQLISEILRVAMEQVPSEAGSFFEIDYNSQSLFFRAVTGRSSQNLLNFTVPLGQGIVGFVCETQQPMALSSVDDSSIHLKSISNAIGFEAKNLLAYPIVIRGTTFGCIEVLNRLGEAQYTDADKEVMTMVAEYAAKVIEQRLSVAALSKELQALRGYSKKDEAA